ncbi:MAG: HD domain-containing protein [Candidatus Harrisonbacteria bacterium]|nr:HD domain-containing protein [Candidatus Harrisonbacteria bacterium]
MDKIHVENDAAYTTWLEKRFDEILSDLKVSSDERRKVRSLLAPLRNKNSVTHLHYQHSLRVALLLELIAKFMNLDVKALVYAGVFHDIGKTQAPISTLEKTSGWTAKDTRVMKAHVMDSYRLLRGTFDFTAEVILWHHRFQVNGYPSKLPKKSHSFSRATEALITFYGRMLALADCYDALHRANDKFGGAKLSAAQIKEKMLVLNPDLRRLIEDLYDADIFMEEDEQQDERHLDVLYKIAWENQKDVRTPRETGRQVMLACALEPLSDKTGCTTRHRNVSRHLKLEYFVIGGINIGEAFEDLARSVRQHSVDGQPPIYHFALRAQKESLRNRGGGRINHGIIELLIPVVASQHLFDLSSTMKTEDILQKAVAVLRATTREDVDRLVEMKQLVHVLSNYTDRKIAKHPKATNVLRYYEEDLAVSAGKPTSIAHNSEFVQGFPTVKCIYKAIIDSHLSGLGNKVAEAYQRACCLHDEKVGRGFLADCVAVALYLCLSQHKQIKFTD